MKRTAKRLVTKRPEGQRPNRSTLPLVLQVAPRTAARNGRMKNPLGVPAEGHRDGSGYSIGSPEVFTPSFQPKPISASTKRRCILCGRVFRTADMVHPGVALQPGCPTPGCESTAELWVHPGDPLLCEEAWEEWDRAIAEYEKHEWEVHGAPLE